MFFFSSGVCLLVEFYFSFLMLLFHLKETIFYLIIKLHFAIQQTVDKLSFIDSRHLLLWKIVRNHSEPFFIIINAKLHSFPKSSWVDH